MVTKLRKVAQMDDTVFEACMCWSSRMCGDFKRQIAAVQTTFTFADKSAYKRARK